MAEPGGPDSTGRPVRAPVGPVDHDAFFSITPMIFVVADLNARVVEVNHEWEKVLGYTPDEVRGTSIYDYIHPDDIAATDGAMSELVEGGDVVGFVNRYRHRDGSLRVISWHAAPRDGLIYAAAEDVTQKVRDREDLERSQRLHQTLFDVTGQGVVYQDRDGRIIDANPAAQDMLGLTLDQMTGRTSTDPRWRAVRNDGSPFPGEEHPAMVALRTGQPVLDVVMGVYHPVADSYKWLRIRSVPQYEPDDHAPYMVSTTFDDITWDRAAEQRIRAHVESLERAMDEQSESRAELESLMRAVNRHTIVSMTDLDGRITQANDNFCSVSGYSRDELIGRTHHVVNSGLHPPEFWQNLWRTILRGEAWQGEIRNRRKDGSFYWVLSTILPFTDARGRLASFVSIRTDITGLKEAELAANEATRAKSSFLANMSHEIRTPLTAIIGLSVLAEAPSLDPAMADTLAQIRRAGEHLLEMLNDVLDFERIAADRVELHTEPFSVRQQVEQVAGMYSAQAAGKGVHLDVQVQDSVPALCSGDPLRLRQVLLNLVSNAVKMTDAGSVSIAVTSADTAGPPPGGGAQERSAALTFTVKDTGPGVAPQDRERIFEPFAQGDQSLTRVKTGTGLGLAISAGLVQVLGGRLGLEPTGRGASFTFTLTFPVVPAGGDDAAAVQSPGSGGDTTALAGTVLLVEDNLINRLIASRMLHGLGVDVVCVEDGRAAVEMFRGASRSDFDAVLMDIHMPVMDGWTATGLIRDLPAGRDVPIVALTANALTGDRERSMAAGMDDHISKPFTGADLAAVLRRWLAPRTAIDTANHQP